ncbi:MAG: CBS domain-containing protein [Haloarculaceae archaeon]
MFVQDLMTTDVVTVDVDASLQTAVGRLLEHNVGSVVVVDEDEHPLGILTEEDALRGGYQAGDPFEAMTVRDVAHRPLVTTKPTATVPHVANKMANNDVKRVPVMEDLDLVGIITLTDIVWHLSEIRAEASKLQHAREKWDPNG